MLGLRSQRSTDCPSTPSPQPHQEWVETKLRTGDTPSSRYVPLRTGHGFLKLRIDRGIEPVIYGLRAEYASGIHRVLESPEKAIARWTIEMHKPRNSGHTCSLKPKKRWNVDPIVGLRGLLLGPKPHLSISFATHNTNLGLASKVYWGSSP